MRVQIVGAGPAGLYFGILLKKAQPSSDIQIVEKNPADVTWGWGVVFSDETLEGFQDADPPSYDSITNAFARWDAIDVHFRGEKIQSRGHAFYGIRRVRLLQILQQRAKELGVKIQFETEVKSPEEFASYDLVVAADGINSRMRDLFTDSFQPDIATGKNRYTWLAATKVYESFKFFFRENKDGFFVVHAYPFDRDMSTFIVETDEQSWRSASLHEADESQTVRYCENLFKSELDGGKLLSNKSSWIAFKRIKNSTWKHNNIILIGDAAHTAHFSIGSGTKLAMEDAIKLADAFSKHGNVEDALRAYQEGRWIDVAKLQRAAEVSQRFFEDIRRWKEFEPQQFAVKLLTRSKRVTHGNLKLRDPEYIAAVDRWFADHNGCANIDPPPPPMFTPFKLRGMELMNRVVVSAMCQYSSEDGLPNDWHLVHLGTRAIGGAALVFTEMTDISRDGRISPGCAGMYKTDHAQAWKRVVDFVHKSSRAKIGMQLAHAGRKGSTKLSWEGIDEPLPDGNWALISASPIPWSDTNQVPRQMDHKDMTSVIADFAQAAKWANEAGFDIIELHMAHGYLLSSFLSPLTNQRRDEFGGSIENRMRFPMQVFDAVRKAWPSEKPISVRISATDWAPDGLTPEDSVAIASMLKEHGCDIIDVSTGQTVPFSQPVYGRMYQAPFADKIRNEANIPTITVGSIQNWDQVNTLLVSGQADLIALARAHLYDPYFTLHAAADQDYEVDWPNQYLPAKPRRRKG